MCFRGVYKPQKPYRALVRSESERLRRIESAMNDDGPASWSLQMKKKHAPLIILAELPDQNDFSNKDRVPERVDQLRRKLLAGERFYCAKKEA